MLPSTWPSTYRSSLPDNSPLITTDLPICAKSADNGALMEFLLLGSGNATDTLGSQYRDVRVTQSTIPKYESMGQAKQRLRTLAESLRMIDLQPFLGCCYTNCRCLPLRKDQHGHFCCAGAHCQSCSRPS